MSEKENSKYITCKIVEEYGQISEGKNGWKRILRKISWNGRKAKYDIRDWAPEDRKAGKGITVSSAELQRLKDILCSMTIEDSYSAEDISEKTDGLNGEEDCVAAVTSAANIA